MKPREVLKRIIEERQEDFKEYAVLCSKVEVGDVERQNRLKTRMSILTLEFPFKTDSVNVNQALMLQQSRDEGFAEEKSIQEWCQQSLSNGFDERYQRVSFSRFLEKESIWPKVAQIKYLPEDRAYLEVPDKVPVGDLISDLPCQALIDNIAKSGLKSSSKLIYQSYVKNVIGYIRGESRHKEFAIPHGVELHALADYFNHLEQRCLNSDSLKNYIDLIEVRLLFYICLKTDLLRSFTLSNINRKSQRLCFAGEEYRMPLTFIDLIHTVVMPDKPLLNKTVKQLEKFVRKTSSKLNLKGISPKTIKHSQDSLAKQLGLVKERLPAR